MKSQIQYFNFHQVKPTDDKPETTVGGFFIKASENGFFNIMEEKYHVSISAFDLHDAEIVEKELKYHNWTTYGTRLSTSHMFLIPFKTIEEARKFAKAISHRIQERQPNHATQVMVFANDNPDALDAYLIVRNGVYRYDAKEKPEEVAVSFDDCFCPKQLDPEQKSLYDHYDERIDKLAGRLQALPIDDVMVLLGEILKDRKLSDDLKKQLYARIDNLMMTIRRLFAITSGVPDE